MLRGSEDGSLGSSHRLTWKSPVPHATPAVRSGVPARRAVIERTTTAIGTAVPAIAAATEHLDHLRILILLQRRDRHGSRGGHSCENGACKKSNGDKILHQHPPVPRACFDSFEMTAPRD